MSAVYLFHQRMYSDRHPTGPAGRSGPVGYSEPTILRLVAFDHLPMEFRLSGSGWRRLARL